MKKNVTVIVFIIASLFLTVDFYPQSFSNGEIGVTLSGAGRVRIHKDSTTAPRQIDRSSILVGSGPDAVFGYNQDADNEDPVINVENPQISDYELYGAANNAWSNLPPNILSKSNVYGWTTGGYVLVKFTEINREETTINAVIGMEIIAQLNGSYGLETVEWLPEEEIVVLYREGEPNYVGYKLVSSEMTSVTFIDWYDGYDTLDTFLWDWLTTNEKDTMIETGGDGAVAFFAQDAVGIAQGDSAIVWVAISVGDDLTEMISNMTAAVAKFGTITEVKQEESGIPSTYALRQNYPNPFNPATTITFSLPSNEFVILKVYDILGNEITTLVNTELMAGTHSVKFSPKSLTSGMYFYQLTAGNYTETKKMNLLK